MWSDRHVLQAINNAKLIFGLCRIDCSLLNTNIEGELLSKANLSCLINFFPLSSKLKVPKSKSEQDDGQTDG